MGRKSKNKGSGYERSVCERLSIWVSNRTRDDVFWRSAMSGGRATIRSRRARKAEVISQAGDISAIHSSGEPLLSRFFIECKFWADLSLEAAIFGNAGRLEDIWHIPRRQAAIYKRHPLVVAKQNRRNNELIFTDRAGVRLLTSARKRRGAFPVRWTIPTIGLYAFHFRDLLADVSYPLLSRQIAVEAGND